MSFQEMRSSEARVTEEAGPPTERPDAAPLDFDQIYRNHAAFVWRSVCRLGIPDAAADDVTQEIFVVVHRRLGDYHAGSSLKAWLYGIARGVVANARRAQARRLARQGVVVPHEDEPRRDDEPQAAVERTEAVRILYAILDHLDDDKREVFLLAELEQMPAPEIAAALGLNVNTTYARIRAARRQFKEAVARHRAGERRQS